MLKKLFKHEIAATARLLVPLYLILIFLSVMDRIVLRLDIFHGAMQVIPGIITFIYVMTIITLIAVTIVLMVLRFYKNFLSDEGYLMFTLPVKTNQLINSKLLVSVIWSIASILIVFLSILFVAAEPNSLHEFWLQFKEGLTELKQEFGKDYTLFIIEIIALLIVGLLNSILNIYVSIAIGQLLHNHKILGSIGAYIAINTAVQIIATVCAFLAGPFVSDEISSVTQFILPLIILFLLVFDIIYYFATYYLFKNKLNLE